MIEMFPQIEMAPFHGTRKSENKLSRDILVYIKRETYQRCTSIIFFKEIKL